MVNDFIGIYNNSVPDNYCDDVIDYFERMINEGRTVTRQSNEGSQYIKKHNDIYYFETETDPLVVEKNSRIVQTFCNALNGCYMNYQEDVGVLNSLGRHSISESIMIQRSRPSQGYHVWHCESANIASSRRLMLAILYLNDVEEGGETEFLYQRLRVPAKKGTMLLCPASYTHTHRGNPPLSNNKYIITTWLEFVE